jgi:hypothetical protein
MNIPNHTCKPPVSQGHHNPHAYTRRLLSARPTIRQYTRECRGQSNVTKRLVCLWIIIDNIRHSAYKVTP